MFVIKPDPYSLPCYRIGPFTTRDLSINHNMPDDSLIDDYCKERFSGKQFIYTVNGRHAIEIALKSCNLSSNDIVTIFTTSGNFYISSCVTKEIEKFCRWSRKLEKETRVILVNHEFGYPFVGLRKLKAYGLPIIEDCASSFFSTDKTGEIGNIGDFVVFSFPKMFPLQIGGLLVSKEQANSSDDFILEANHLKYIRNILSFYIKKKDEIMEKRRANYCYLKDKFEYLGLLERFSLADGIVPAVFMFRTDNVELDLPGLKKYFWDHGVQCSVFYGEEAFFLPAHQALNEYDLQYFYEVMRSFLQKQY